MAHPLDGIREKIKRAEKHIDDLELEIDRFLDYGIKPFISDDDMQSLDELVNKHMGRPVDPKLSVLAGEVVHQLRSTLDHLAWQLSSAFYRRCHPKWIEFPVCVRKPNPIGDKRERGEAISYDRKVQSMSTFAKAEIERLQPYHSVPPMSNALAIIHEMDIIEKHHQLLIVVSAFEHTISSPMVDSDGIMFYAYADVPIPANAGISPNVKVRGQYSAQVAFAEFGILQHQPVIPSLKQLLGFVRGIVATFEREF